MTRRFLFSGRALSRIAALEMSGESVSWHLRTHFSCPKPNKNISFPMFYPRAGRPAPPKPWERAGASGPATPSSSTPAEGLPKPWEAPSSEGTTIVPTQGAATTGTPGTPQAPRPWERAGDGALATTSTALGGGTYASPYGSAYGGSSLMNRPGYGGYGASAGYGGTAGYGSSMYGGTGAYGGTYGGGYGANSMYGGGMYNSPYGGVGVGMYGRSMYGGGGGMYGGGMGMGMYGGGGMMGGPMMGQGGQWDPNDPNGPPTPPSAWQAMLAGIGGLMHFFGRLSFLVDENAHAVHFFVTALLQLLDRFGSLYGELARFVLRMLGFRPKDKKQPIPGQQQIMGPDGVPYPNAPHGAQHLPHRPPQHAQHPSGSTSAPWDNVWGKNN